MAASAGSTRGNNSRGCSELLIGEEIGCSGIQGSEIRFEKNETFQDSQKAEKML